METGLILGRYRPLAELGEGGHGYVDLAFDTKMARRVAIKRIPLSRAGAVLLSKTTGLKEARTTALLNHPNIITVYEWDTDSDEAFLIMEHVDGAALSEVLAEYAPLDRDEAAAVLAPIAEALMFAHDNGVLHLDLKPDNVLVTRDGLVKVGDFGVASLTNAAGQTISAGGTLGYMPPEQLRGDPVDARTDVWAFAALAFEVLAGAVPFASDTFEGALFKAERTGVPDASEFVASIPPEVDDLFQTAFSPEPADRPARIEEFANDLLAYLGRPNEGRAALAALVGGLVQEDEEDEEPSLGRLGLWDRLARGSSAAGRLSTALASGYMAWLGMQPLGLGAIAGVVATVVAAIAGAAAPQVGLAVGIVLLAIGAFAAWTPLGVVATLAGALWWALVCRRAPSAGAVPAFAFPAGAVGLGAALPLLSGFFIGGVWAAGAAGAASGAVLVAIRLLLSANVREMVAGPSLANVFAGAWAQRPGLLLDGTWLLPAAAIVVGWGLAGVLAAIGARRGTRPGAAVGAIGGLLAMIVAVGPWVTGQSQLASADIIQLGLASILMAVIIALGPPVQTDD